MNQYKCDFIIYIILYLIQLNKHFNYVCIYMYLLNNKDKRVNIVDYNCNVKLVLI